MEVMCCAHDDTAREMVYCHAACLTSILTPFYYFRNFSTLYDKLI